MRPLIADIFQGDRRLIPLSKVMFLTFVFNALAIVQTNRLMKRMDVKMIAVSNVIAQVAGGALGIGLALAGYGAWALVWQSVALAGIKTGILWATGRWLPTCWIKKELSREGVAHRAERVLLLDAQHCFPFDILFCDRRVLFASRLGSLHPGRQMEQDGLRVALAGAHGLVCAVDVPCSGQCGRLPQICA